jgi:hypothetical protein
MVSMANELTRRDILKLILIVRFAYATLGVGHPIFSHGSAEDRLFPECAHKIFTGSIKFHPFHVEIKDTFLLVHRKTEAKRINARKICLRWKYLSMRLYGSGE